MKEAVLLNSILKYLSTKRDIESYGVYFNISDGIEITLKTKNSVQYSLSMLSKTNIITDEKNDSVFNNCFNSFKKFSNKSQETIILVKEGIDEITGDIVYVKVEYFKNSKDSLLFILCRELDRCNNMLGVSSNELGSFIFDSYEKHTDIYPLHTKIEGIEEEIILKVYNGVIIDSGGINKAITFKNDLVKGIFSCLWSLLGNYIILVRVLRNDNKFYPVMYNLYLDSSVCISELC